MYTLKTAVVLLASGAFVVWLATFGWFLGALGLLGLWVVWAWRVEEDRRAYVGQVSKRRTSRRRRDRWDLHTVKWSVDD